MEDGVFAFLFVPTIIFVCFVAPVWIFMHYRSKQQARSSLSDDERLELEELAAQAERMIERIDTLESILDSETPGWRNRMGREYSHE
ncbi:MAG: envelope stress response membrane protein PspB [Pseudomonadota bacterium]